MRLLSKRTILSAALAFMSATPAVAHRQQSSATTDVINIPFERYTLPNGLTVILAPEHSTPRVTVDVWYHVGSKNEAPGRTGFAHLFEHVMFTGSGNAAYGLHDRLTNGVGGTNNGSTDTDRTDYYESVPSNYLESTLWLEADRMGFLLDKLDSAKFVAQRDIVQNERRQRIENAPYARASEIVSSVLYAGNPYSWPVVGYMTDLQAATVSDVKQFFRTYYSPSNATISIVGDFNPAEAKRLVAKYFGDLPRGRAITRPTVTPPRFTTEKRLTFEDRVQVPRLHIVWPTVGRKHDDSYVLNVMSAILSSGRTSRLLKTLVYDRQLATTLPFVGNIGRESLGEFGIVVTPRAGQSLTAIETSIDSILARFKHEGPTADEMQRAKASLEIAFVSALEDNLGKADMLNNGQVYYGDPANFKKEYVKYRNVTAADVKRVANTYLGPGRVVLSIVPQGKLDLASKPESSVKVTVTPDARYIMESK